MDFSDQERIFGTLLGSVPNIRAKTNGVVIYKGYVVAEFGDNDVGRSDLLGREEHAGDGGRRRRCATARSPTSTRRSARPVKDGGYDSPRNAQVTWKHHLQQVSEWEGNMFGKQDNFIGKEAFGEGEMKPREQKKPGTHYEYNDVRINRFALSLLRAFNKPVPDVFRDEVMDPIGASNTWRWIPYHNSWVDLNGRKVASVSGGTRWGGGMWINSYGHGALRLPVAARRQVGRQADCPAGVREGGVDAGRRGQLSRQRLRLPVVAQHHAARRWRACRPTRFRRTAPAATPSRCRPTTTSSSCGAGTRAARASSPGASSRRSSPERCSD